MGCRELSSSVFNYWIDARISTFGMNVKIPKSDPILRCCDGSITFTIGPSFNNSWVRKFLRLKTYSNIMYKLKINDDASLIQSHSGDNECQIFNCWKISDQWRLTFKENFRDCEDHHTILVEGIFVFLI